MPGPPRPETRALLQALLEQRSGQFGHKMAGQRQMAQNPLQNLLTVGSLAPGIGDAAGLGADAMMFKNEPASRTLGNAAMSMAGLLPFVPSASAARMASRKITDAKPYGRKVTVLQNPSDDELRQFRQAIRDDFKEKGWNASANPLTRNTLDANGNRWVWQSDEGTHFAMEEWLKKNVVGGAELGQNKPGF